MVNDVDVYEDEESLKGRILVLSERGVRVTQVT
jgi:hypothetical protein